MNLTSRPAGFGPIPPHWQPRLRYAGTYDEAWQRDRYPLYPTDLDDRFFLCSPEDQRPNRVPPRRGVGGTAQPDAGRATRASRCPGWHSASRRSSAAATGCSTAGQLHTVILEPDVPRVILVWRTELPCHPGY